jgi:hypothetical protein
MNYDGTNYAAVHARTKAEALKLIGTTRYQFKENGHETFEDLPSFGEVYYKPISNYVHKLPWRKNRYFLRHDDKGNSYYI